MLSQPKVFVNVSFDSPGVYWVEVHLEETLKLRYPLRVGQVQIQPASKPPPYTSARTRPAPWDNRSSAT